jgi:predicted transposase YbfD/YdcC
MHWSLDTTFGEDASRKRAEESAEISQGSDKCV